MVVTAVVNDGNRKQSHLVIMMMMMFKIVRVGIKRQTVTMIPCRMLL